MSPLFSLVSHSLLSFSSLLFYLYVILSFLTVSVRLSSVYDTLFCLPISPILSLSLSFSLLSFSVLVFSLSVILSFLTVSVRLSSVYDTLFCLPISPILSLSLSFSLSLSLSPLSACVYLFLDRE